MVAMPSVADMLTPQLFYATSGEVMVSPASPDEDLRSRISMPRFGSGDGTT
jgi:hypothetical protein